MRPSLLGTALAVCWFCVPASAADPLRLVPDVADVVLEVRQPRKLVESLTANDLLKHLRQLPALQEFFESTNVRRFEQLVAYYEKELGAPYPELIDKLASDGVVAATKFGTNPPPVLLVIEGRDADLTKKFFGMFVQVIEQELARQESPEKIEKKDYRKVEVVKLGKETLVAAVGSALLISNKDEAMKAALDLYHDGGERSMSKVASLADARKLLPTDPLAALWVNLKPAHDAPGSDVAFKLPRKEFGVGLTVLFGGNLDVAARAPFACAGLYAEKDGFKLTTRLPAGREGSDAAMTVHIPPAGEVGSRPLLKPKHVLFSTSFYLDVAKFWDDRAKLYSPEHLQALETFDKSSAAVLNGTPFGKLLGAAGPYHRFVAAHQDKPGYTITPQTSIPAFAFVTEQRDPEVFGRTLEGLARTGALFASNQAGLKLKDEEHNGVKIVGYRFDEKFKLKQDVQDLRFNFSPCMFTVGKKWVVASTLELGRELCDILLAEEKAGPTGDAASVRSEFYGEGGAELLKSIEDVLITQSVLDQAVPAGAAREQVKTFIEVVRRLGTLHLESGYEAKTFHYDLRLKMGK